MCYSRYSLFDVIERTPRKTRSLKTFVNAAPDVDRT